MRHETIARRTPSLAPGEMIGPLWNMSHPQVKASWGIRNSRTEYDEELFWLSILNGGWQLRTESGIQPHHNTIIRKKTAVGLLVVYSSTFK